MAASKYGTQYSVSEWGFTSGKPYADPFNQVELDVIFTHEQGGEWRVPAYWAGGQEWRVRFGPPAVGTYTYRTACSDEGNPDLHGQTGTLQAAPYEGQNPLLQHGPVRVSADHTYLEHADGTPFFWLGDTWWMGFCKRLGWPEDFQRLTADRVQKGFTVVQIVAGLYPDMPAYDPRGFNEAGHPWEPEYARIRPAYFDMADIRLQWLVRSGIVPCVVACWGYHLPWLGIDKIKQHWRNLVARYSAYPVVWCLAGEGAMPYYLAEDKQAARTAQVEGWTDLGRYLRAIDPYQRPVTIHPTDSARNQVTDDSVLDLDMLQTGHGGYASIANTVEKVRAAVERQPHMPVIEGEVNYEGILEGSRQEIQRIVFWTCLLQGAAGFTYGANGIWQVNTEDVPYGPSPHGASWGNTPWTEAYRLPGSGQIALGKRLLERYPWWRFEYHQEWVEAAASAENYMGAYAAGIPGQVRVIYFPQPLGPWGRPQYVQGLEPGVTYRAFFWNPATGQEHDLGIVAPGERYQVPVAPIIQDWILVLERAES